MLTSGGHASAPTGIVLPKPRSAADALALAAVLDSLEEQHGIVQGRTRILSICTETPRRCLRWEVTRVRRQDLQGFPGAPRT